MSAKPADIEDGPHKAKVLQENLQNLYRINPLR